MLTIVLSWGALFYGDSLNRKGNIAKAGLAYIVAIFFHYPVATYALEYVAKNGGDPYYGNIAFLAAIAAIAVAISNELRHDTKTANMFLKISFFIMVGTTFIML